MRPHLDRSARAMEFKQATYVTVRHERFDFASIMYIMYINTWRAGSSRRTTSPQSQFGEGLQTAGDVELAKARAKALQ